MKINKELIDLDKALEIADIDSIILKRRKNNILLSDYQVAVLLRNGIDYRIFNNTKELLFMIEECLNDLYDEELEIISNQIGEYIYYSETKK